MRRPALSLYRPLESARARIVAFPHAGSGASAFRGLNAALAPLDIELCALQPPGRENRLSEPCHRMAGIAAEEFAEAVLSLPVCPTVFLGHSLGGLLAYLTAQRLQGTRAMPTHLVASASRSPALSRTAHLLGGDGDLTQRLAILGGLPEIIRSEPSFLEMFEAIIRADLHMGQTHDPWTNTALACPITVYSGESDPLVPPSGASAWQSLSRQPLRTRRFPGGHFFLYEMPALVAQALVADLGWQSASDASSKDHACAPRGQSPVSDHVH